MVDKNKLLLIRMSLKNKVAIITGGSSGIGAKTAILFAKEGAKIAIVGRNATKLASVSAECEKFGSKPLILNVDVSKDDEAKTIVSKTITHFGRLDILINNAGISSSMNGIQDPNLMDAFDRIISVNLRSVFLITQLAMPELKKTKGNIVNISSIFGLSPVTQMLAYATSKAGLTHFTKCLALEVANDGVRVNSVNPGPVVTDIIINLGIDEETSNRVWEHMGRNTPMKCVTQPEEVADLIAFLASDKAISCTGGVYPIDCGTMLVGCEVLNKWM